MEVGNKYVSQVVIICNLNLFPTKHFPGMFKLLKHKEI